MAKMRDRERRAAQLAIYRTARARMQIQRWSRQAIQNMRRRKREERLRRIEAARLQAEKADHITQRLSLTVGQDHFFLTLRNNVLLIDDALEQDDWPDTARATMSREELIAVVAHVTSLNSLAGWQQASAQALASLIED